MARPKKLRIELHNLDACTRAMGDLLLMTTQLEALEAERAQEVATASATYEKSIDDARKMKGDLEEGLKAFYYAHLGELEKDGQKRVQLANGVMGRRDNPPKLSRKNSAWGWDTICRILREKYAGKYFIPSDPKPDKERIKAELDAEGLDGVGLKLEQDETFYAVPARLPVPEMK